MECFSGDWWTCIATILSGIITAMSTIGAVIYTNKKNSEQWKKQDELHALEMKQQFQRHNYVVLKTNLLLISLCGILDKMIIQMDYNRALLYSGNDGFEFFDDPQKRSNQQCRLLMIENQTTIDIRDVSFSTKSILKNMDTNEKIEYETHNYTSFLRGHESLIIRLMNQQQYEKILLMNEKKIPSLLEFECVIKYLTLANQRLEYTYQIRVFNDKNIEVQNDGIKIIKDDDSSSETKLSTSFRNLQDYISGVDRSEYAWTKMAQTQVQTMLSQINFQNKDRNLR